MSIKGSPVGDSFFGPAVLGTAIRFFSITTNIVEFMCILMNTSHPEWATRITY